MPSDEDIHATGAPDTPVEVLTDLLGRALKADDSKSLRSLVERAHAVVSGLDPYLEQISSPPDQVGHTCTSETAWRAFVSASSGCRS